MSSDVLALRLVAAGQGHILEHLRGLPPGGEESDALRSQLSAMPLERVADIFRVATETAAAATSADIQPPPSGTLFSRQDPRADDAWAAAGRDLIAKGKTAVCVLAGGQATRLGVPYPKGMLVLPGLNSGKSLFQLQAEKVLRAQTMAGGGGRITFLLMTSEATHADVTTYFESHAFCGLEPSQVRFFQQGTLPCLTPDGAKMILESNSRVAVAPNGNGGIYHALRDSGLLASMAAEGVQYLQVYSVDNPLARIADPSFFGLCHTEGLDVVAKCTAKVAPQEAVGVFARRDGRWGVTEYSEIGGERAGLVDPATGRLRFDAANLAIHGYRVSFLAECAAAMDQPNAMYHLAKKDIPCATGKTTAVKLEAFIFDVFALTERFGLMDVAREDEFSAVKNAEGAARDTPSTARADLDRLHRRWLKAAGATVVDGEGFIEVSPLVSFAGEGLEGYAGRTVTAPAYIA